MEAEDILNLIDKSAKMARDDMKAVIENHLDASERVIANVSVMRTVRDGSNLLNYVAANPEAMGELAKADPT